MKPTKLDYTNAVEALYEFDKFRPNFNARGSYSTDLEECRLADAINCLSYTASMYARAEDSYYTRAQVAAALKRVQAET